MKKLAFVLLPLIACAALTGCGKKESAPATTPQPAAEAPAAPTAPANEPATTDQNATAATQPEAAPSAPAEAISETDDAAPATEQTSASVQPAVKLGGSATTAPTSANFKEGTNYQRLVPAQPTTVAPDKVEVVEVFWYGCGHCFRLDPAIESWRAKSKPGYVEFVRVPAMWNDTTRMHARLYYATELLGKGDELHSLIFREFHVNGNQLNTVEKIAAFFKQHGVGNEEFNKAFSSFAVESKLQRADFLNRRYRVQSVPMMVVNGKYTTDVGMAGSEPQLFALIGELAAHEHGG